MSSVDQHEDSVDDLARRAALAASQRRRHQRESGVPSTAAIQDDCLQALAPVLERICANENVRGLKLTRGPGALSMAAISEADDDSESDIDRLLTAMASSIAHQSEVVLGTDLGSLRDAAISFSDGAVLTRWVGQDLLLVAVSGHPAPLTDVWQAMRAAASEIESICSTISL